MFRSQPRKRSSTWAVFFPKCLGISLWIPSSFFHQESAFLGSNYLRWICKLCEWYTLSYMLGLLVVLFLFCIEIFFWIFCWLMEANLLTVVLHEASSFSTVSEIHCCYFFCPPTLQINKNGASLVCYEFLMKTYHKIEEEQYEHMVKGLEDQ